MHFLLPIFSTYHEFIRLQPHHKMRDICMTWSIELNVLPQLFSLQNPFTTSAWIVLPIHSPASSDMEAQKAPSLQLQQYWHCWYHSRCFWQSQCLPLAPSSKSPYSTSHPFRSVSTRPFKLSSTSFPHSPKSKLPLQCAMPKPLLSDSHSLPLLFFLSISRKLS